MKKLMIAAVIVCAAVVSQAASYNWTVKTSTAVYDGWNGTTDDASYGSATAQAGLTWMLVLSSANTRGDGDSAYAGLSEVDALAAIRANGTIDSKYILASGTTTADGVAKTSFTTTDVNLDSAGKMNAYLVILNDDEDAPSVYMGMETGKAADTQGGTSDYSLAVATSKYQRDVEGVKDFGGKTKTGWYAVSTVPEPTSGFLLLIGMAGLALRRRRA